MSRDDLAKLERYIANLGRVAVAYSGGVDSTFLLATCARVLGNEHVLALTIQSPLIPPWELEFAVGFCRDTGLQHRVLNGSCVFEDERVISNPMERCYYCKKRLLDVMQTVIPDTTPLLTATNASDESDFRPGMRAEAELGIKTPLRELGFSKHMIRKYSEMDAIPGFDRPSGACFATRIPYGDPISVEKVRMIEQAETFVRNLGLEVVRVRLLSRDVACIEVGEQEIEKCLEFREQIVGRLADLGFRRVTLDLEGYRSGKLHCSIGK